MGGMLRRVMRGLGMGTGAMAGGEKGSMNEMENGALTEGEKEIEGQEDDDKYNNTIACWTTRTERNNPCRVAGP